MFKKFITEILARFGFVPVSMLDAAEKDKKDYKQFAMDILSLDIVNLTHIKESYSDIRYKSVGACVVTSNSNRMEGCHYTSLLVAPWAGNNCFHAMRYAPYEDKVEETPIAKTVLSGLTLDGGKHRSINAVQISTFAGDSHPDTIIGTCNISNANLGVKGTPKSPLYMGTYFRNCKIVADTSAAFYECVFEDCDLEFAHWGEQSQHKCKVTNTFDGAKVEVKMGEDANEK